MTAIFALNYIISATCSLALRGLITFEQQAALYVKSQAWGYFPHSKTHYKTKSMHESMHGFQFPTKSPD